MADYRQILLYLLLIVKSVAVYGSASLETKEEKEELVETETRDGKLEIIKKIKKINDDGSYTIGYEADDGSFKIESRDVLGHIKGTYGFVDDDGNIKRVSYSTVNATELLTKPIPTSSVVQRIPAKNKTTTRIPYFSTSFSSTSSTPTTPNIVAQNIAKRRTTLITSTSSTTTAKPNYNDIVNISRSTSRPNYVTYTSAPPRVLLQGRPSTIADSQTPKPEGQQLMRPEIVTVKPTELPILKTLTLKRLEDDKPVHEEYEPEVRGNILRRQLSPLNQNFNIREEVYRLQQSMGHDHSDVYSNSMTTGHPKPPLFTTTLRPRPIPISTTPIPRPSIQYPIHFQRTPIHDIEPNQETTTVQTIHSTPTPIPISQIPSNRPEDQELVAVKYPPPRGTILVPVAQINGRLVPLDQIRQFEEDQRSYGYIQEPPTTRVVEIEQQKAIVRRLPPPALRPIPVQVDEHGFIRELPRQVPTPYPLPVPVTSAPVPVQDPLSKYVEADIDNEIDSIQPPVSTRDFQRLLQQLILRQSRLEKISVLTRQPEVYLQMQQRVRPVYSEPEPYVVQRIPVDQQAGSLQYLQEVPQEQIQRPHPKYIDMEPRRLPRIHQQNLYVDQYDPQSYRPNRRVARLQPNKPNHQDEEKTEYLPPNVREMLLLRMLQLAINPSLPVDENDLELVPTAPVPKKGVRNVEILGEEESASSKRRYGRIKRYAEFEEGY